MLSAASAVTNHPMNARALLDAALQHAFRGWHVFPLRPDDKRPAFPQHSAAACDHRDTRCRGGHQGWEQRATTDPDRITRAWSSTHRDGRPFGIGIATGPSQLVVVDLDQAKDGEPPPAAWANCGARDGAGVLAALCERAGEDLLLDTYTVRTGSGGRHLYFQAPAGASLRNTTGSLGWLIDTRANGGYVVAAPSTVAGRRYEVTCPGEPAALPSWLQRALEPVRHGVAATQHVARSQSGSTDRYLAAAVAGEVRRVATAQPGRRNHTLFVASLALGQLVAGGALPETRAVAALLDAVTGHVDAGAFSSAEAMATIRSGLTRGAREPRRLPCAGRDVA